jgi:tRNA-splicing ligase RtcB
MSSFRHKIQRSKAPCPVNVHADQLDPLAAQQIEQVRTHPALEGLIAIMPDAHAGAGCVIGFTGRYHEGVIPNLVGVDIGCGVAVYPLSGVKEIDFPALDKYIRRFIPLGMERHPNLETVRNLPVAPELQRPALALCTEMEHGFFNALNLKKYIAPHLQMGTLGGGNHFIEIDRSPAQDEYYLLIHSGSRNAGKRIADYFQKQALMYTRNAGIEVAKGMEFLPLDGEGKAYLHWAEKAQEYARWNRRFMLALILKFFGLKFDEENVTESIHNYIDPRDNIIRKGAIAAYAGQKVVIPLNMADGTLLGEGKGNPEYNFSAPHGAGRCHSRREMMRRLKQGDYTLSDYEHAMQGVFSTSVTSGTFDESPFAYKDSHMIETYVRETVEITAHLKPVYNLKAQ